MSRSEAKFFGKGPILRIPGLGLSVLSFLPHPRPRGNSMKRMTIAMLSCASLILFFQNCSNNNAGFAQGTDSSASTAVPVTGDVLGLFNFTDIAKVHVNGSISVLTYGSASSDTVILLDHDQHSFNATMVDSVTLLPSLTCHSAGSLANYNSLETALQSLSFTSTQNSGGSNFDFLNASLDITLRNGTVKSFSINTNSNHLSIDHVSHIDAMALTNFTRVLITNAGCSF